MKRPARSGRRGRGGERARRAGELNRERVLAALARSDQEPISPHVLLGRLGGHRHHSRELKTLLRALESERRVEKVGGRYRLVRRDGLVEARCGQGGVAVDARGRVWDVSDSLIDQGEARRGERVLVQPVGDPERGRAEVVAAPGAERGQWLGLYRRAGRGGVVVPYRDDGDWTLTVAPADTDDARPGEVVVAVAVDGASQRSGPPRARVIERLGRPGEPEVDFRAVVWHRRLPVAFPQAVLDEAAGLPEAIGDEERAVRADLRHLPFVTVDPATARDHDDAVCVEPLASGARLWVAVADVAHFVREGSGLDREALRRGNSVYFPDRAVPMLPERLSSDLCSLRPDVERRALVVEVEIAADGRPRGARFHAALIRSRARLTYDRVSAALEGDTGAVEASLLEGLRALDALAGILGRRRRQGGSLDFQLPAVEVVVDAAGRPLDVVERAPGRSNRAIEEAMLAANRAVGEALRGEARPAVYRVHDPPDGSDLGDLGDRLAFFGLWKPERGRRARAPLEPRRLSRLLAKAEGPARARIAHGWALRAMKQARYAASPRPHFALAFETYLHFTSPIRRYADLVVHRALKDALAGLPAGPPPGRRERLERIAARLSHRERLAIQAERDAVALRQLEWLVPHLGEVHEGVVQSVGRAGLWVRLASWPIEGLVPARHVPGGFESDLLGLRALDRSGRVRLRVGDVVRVRIEDLDRRRAGLELRWIPSDSRRQPSSSSSSAARPSHSR